MGKIIAVIAGCLGVLTVGIVLMMWVSTTNKEVDLRNSFKAQESVREAFFSKMWKILKQQAKVTDKYQQDFKNLYVGIMEGRYKSGGALFKMITEANPNFDSSMYKKLMVSIEAQREGFFREQKKLIDLKRSHDNLRMKFPSKMFVGSVEEFKLTIITDSKTKNVMETGEENDIDLFD